MAGKVMDTNGEACFYDVNGVSYNSDDQLRKILHKHGDYDISGLSKVIDRATWIGLDDSTKRNIRDYVAAKNRPSNIDKNLWAALSSYDKAHIIEQKNILKLKIERPEEVCFNTWSKLNMNTQSAIIDKLHNIRPSGFDSTLWDSLNDLTKKSITDDLHGYKTKNESEKDLKFQNQLFGSFHRIIDDFLHKGLSPRSRWWILRVTSRPRVLTFFFSGVHVIEDPDSGIGAMVLVCALILTIPFSTFSYINAGWLLSLQTAVESCSNKKSYSGESYGQIHDRMISSLSACMYFSLMGLIISSVYYVFKPLPGKEIDHWCRLQGRALILSLFLVTAAAISSLLSLGLYLLEYSSLESIDICFFHANPSYETGITGIVLSFLLALACMW